jgi:hypothetical protein
MLNLKKLIQKEAQKAILSKAVGKILPMDTDEPKKFGKKSKAAAALVVLAGIATAVAEYL